MEAEMSIQKNRFHKITELRGSTPVLGATVQEWDVALKGDMGQTLVEVKRKAASAVPRDVNSGTRVDVATVLGRTYRSR
jgi:hypothetical protein